MPKEVLQAHVQQVMDVTGCSAERARRELEQHSVEFAINSIFDGPLNQEPVKLQKTSHSPSAPSSSPVRSAFTSVQNTPSKSAVNQGTMVQFTQSPAPQGTFAAISQPLDGKANQNSKCTTNITAAFNFKRNECDSR